MRNKQVDTTERPPWDGSKNVIFAFGGKVRPVKKDGSTNTNNGLSRRPNSAAAHFASSLTHRTPNGLHDNNAPNTNSSGKMGTVEDELYDDFMLRLKGSNYFFGDDESVVMGGGLEFGGNQENNDQHISALDYIENHELQFEYENANDDNRCKENIQFGVRSTGASEIDEDYEEAPPSVQEVDSDPIAAEELSYIDAAPESVDEVADARSSISESIRESIGENKGNNSVISNHFRRGSNDASLDLNLSQEWGAACSHAHSPVGRSPKGTIVVPTESGEDMSFPSLRHLTLEYVQELSALQIAYLFKVFGLGHYKELVLRSNLSGATLVSADEIKLYNLGFHFKPDRKKVLTFILGVKENSRRRKNKFTDMDKVKKIYVSATVNKLFGSLPPRPVTAPTAARGRVAPLPVVYEERTLKAEQQHQQWVPEKLGNSRGSIASSLTALSDQDVLAVEVSVHAAQVEPERALAAPVAAAVADVREKINSAPSEIMFVRSPYRLPTTPVATTTELAIVLSHDIFHAVSCAEPVGRATAHKEDDAGGEYSDDVFENSSAAYSATFEELQEPGPQAIKRIIVNRGTSPSSKGAGVVDSISAASGRLLIGMKVVVNYEGSGSWYPAKIARHVDGCYDVSYDDGDSEFGVPRDSIRTGAEMERAAEEETAVVAQTAAVSAAAAMEEEGEDEEYINYLIDDESSLYKDVFERPDSPTIAAAPEEEPHFMAETISHTQKLPSAELRERIHEQHKVEGQHLPRHEDFMLADAALQKHLLEQEQHEADLLAQVARERRERDVAARKIQTLMRMNQEYQLQRCADQRLRDDARAAVKIQACARRRLACKLVEEERKLRREELLVQIREERAAEERLARSMQRERLASVKIQNVARSKIARQRLSARRVEVRREKVGAIRSRVEAERQRQYMQQKQRAAATTIQTTWRGRAARHEVAARREEHKQREVLRRENTRRLVEQERASHRRLLQEKSAATVIQTRIRILRAKSQLKALEDEKREKAIQLLNSISNAVQRRLQEREAAIKIQCLIRRTTARKRVLDERERQRKLRASERKEAERQRQYMQQKQRAAATTIQTTWRGRAARHEVAARREEHKQRELLRRENTRRLVEQERRLLLKQEQDRDAATKIQSTVRSSQAKKRTLMMKATGAQPLPRPSSDKQLTKKTSEKQLMKKKSSSSILVPPSQRQDHERDLMSQLSHNADSFSGFTSLNDMDDLTEGSAYELHDEIGVDSGKRANELSYPNLAALKPQQLQPKMNPAADDSVWMVVDDGTSKFYFNKVTKECSLDPPAELVKDNKDSAAAFTQKLSSGSNQSKKFDKEKAQWTVRRINSATVNVVDEWEMHMDFETNRPFYFNKRTGVSSWELPENARAAGAIGTSGAWNVLLHRAKSTSTLSSANSMGKEWIVYYDQETDRHFFHNKVTGESTWELPKALLSSASAKPKNNQQDYLRVTSFLHTPNMGVWELLVDQHGQVFYFNKASGESKWRPPSFLLTAGSTNENNNRSAYVDIDDEGDDAHHDAFTIDSDNFDLGI